MHSVTDKRVWGLPAKAVSSALNTAGCEIESDSRNQFIDWGWLIDIESEVNLANLFLAVTAFPPTTPILAYLTG